MNKKYLLGTYLLLITCYLLPAQTGIIRNLTGEVNLKHAGSAEFIPAKPGDRVFQNTIISTGFKSMAIIDIGNTAITVRPVTRLTLTEIQKQDETDKINVNLQSGRIRVEVKSVAGSRTDAKYNSPSAVASVRGTIFELDILSLMVTEGKVVYEGSKGSVVTVVAGSQSFVNSDGSLKNPSEISEAALYPAPPVGAGNTGNMAISSAVLATTADINLIFD